MSLTWSTTSSPRCSSVTPASYASRCASDRPSTARSFSHGLRQPGASGSSSGPWATSDGRSSVSPQRWCRFSPEWSRGSLCRLAGDQGDALHAIGAASVEGPLRDEAVVVRPGLAHREPGPLDCIRVVLPWDCTCDACRPELGVAPRPLLQRLRADDVREGEAPARA